MTRSFQFISLLLLLFLTFAACSRNSYPLKTGDIPIIPVGNEVQKYHLTLDFAGKHFSGMLIAKMMDNEEIRIIASTMFGLNLFDFGLKGEEWRIYSCIEPMRKKRVLKLFETDFKLLFLPGRSMKKIEKTAKYTKFVKGGGMSGSVIYLMHAMEYNPERIQIKHPWLRLTIGMEKMDEDNVTE